MFMGGAYLNDLRDNVTHLVSNSVRTLKYETAAQNNVKIMHVDWVRNLCTFSPLKLYFINPTGEKCLEKVSKH